MASIINFLSAKLYHRHLQGGGKNQLMAKAVGIKSGYRPSVLDVTAGLGRDAFVLATLGCAVTMVERSPVIYAALKEAMARAQQETWFQKLSFQLIFADAIDYLPTLSEGERPEVIYIDPMFPPNKKSALVKKDMRDLREIVGDDVDANQLFLAAIKVAKKRVVVKRARHAPLITDQKPEVVYGGKRSRFDVYITPEDTKP